MKTKYIKVPVSERLPENNLNVILIDALGNVCNGYYSEKTNRFVSTDGYFSTIENWLLEVPDYEDEMREMLEELNNSIDEQNTSVGISSDLYEVWEKIGNFLTKLKQKS